MKLSRSRNIKFVNISIFGKKNRNIWKFEKLRETNFENLVKKLSDKGISIHISNYFQTLEFLEKTLSDKNEFFYQLYIVIFL